MLLFFSHSVMSHSLWPHGLQHARLPLSFTISLPQLTQTHVHWISDAIQPFHPLLSPSLPAFNLSQHQEMLFQWVSSSHQVAKVLEFQLQQHSFPTRRSSDLLLLLSIFPSIRVFSNESVLHIRWPKCWNFSFSISPSNEYSRLISFRIDGFDLLAIQGTLNSPPAPQFQSINSLLLSLLYGPTVTWIHTWLLKKIIALTIWTFVGKIISLLFSMLSRFVIALAFLVVPLIF